MPNPFGFDPLKMLEALPGGADMKAKLIEFIASARNLSTQVDADREAAISHEAEGIMYETYEANERFKAALAALPQIEGITK